MKLHVDELPINHALGFGPLPPGINCNHLISHLSYLGRKRRVLGMQKGSANTAG
jgi:hypothetical protein